MFNSTCHVLYSSYKRNLQIKEITNLAIIKNISIKFHLDGHGKDGNIIGDIVGSLAWYVKEKDNRKERTKRKRNKVCC
jgi:hypothetical protein